MILFSRDDIRLYNEMGKKGQLSVHWDGTGGHLKMHDTVPKWDKIQHFLFSFSPTRSFLPAQLQQVAREVMSSFTFAEFVRTMHSKEH